MPGPPWRYLPALIQSPTFSPAACHYQLETEMISIRRQIAVTPIVAPLARLMYHALTSRHRSFAGSVAYWEQRYREGGCSGAGSYGKFGRFKAQVLNQFVVEHGIRTVMEFGCGDGNQLSLCAIRNTSVSM